MATQGLAAADELLHRIDPSDWSWSESWFFSWIDLDGGPAGVFRIGVTPNQGRAMLWCFLHVDGEWVTVEESRLAWSDFDMAAGVRYDKWGLRFDWAADEPFVDGRFTFDGFGLVRSGPRAGARVPFAIELGYRATAPIHGTGIDPSEADRTAVPTGRFEQSLIASGSVVVDGRSHRVRAGAHRDKSWGPRDWRHCFAIGDIQGEDRQLYFVGRSFPGLAGGYLREGSQSLQVLTCVDGEIAYDDTGRTIGPSRMVFETPDASRVEVSMRPIAPSIAFDVAHSCEKPEHWLYWRTLCEATVSGWGPPARAWFEAGRYGVA